MYKDKQQLCSSTGFPNTQQYLQTQYNSSGEKKGGGVVFVMQVEKGESSATYEDQAVVL